MARTEFRIIDNSDIPSLDVADVTYKPLYFVASSADKGPETYGLWEGQEFVDVFVNNIRTTFDNHGQPMLQALRCVEAGGRILFKRIVAPDAKLANFCFGVQLEKEKVNVTDAKGNQLYIDPTTGQQTTESQRLEDDGQTTVFEKVTVDGVKTTFKVSTDEGCADNDVNSLGDKFVKTASVDDEGVGFYPLFVFADSGRGVSKKIIKFSPDYVSSKARANMRYLVSVYESNNLMESMLVAIDSDTVENKVNLGMQDRINDKSKQIRSKVFYDQLSALAEAIAKITGMDVDTVKTNDFIFGKTRKGDVLSTVITVEDAVGIEDNGIKLMSGSDGSFANANKFESQEYVDELVKAFGGTPESDPDFEPDPIIYDVDNYKLDLVCDANYPAEVKRAIEALVNFREDVFYMRDLGLGLKTVEAILAADELSTKSCYCSSYCNDYEVYDPYSHKRINVTIMYDLAPKMVSHFVYGENRPIAGFLYDFKFDNVIKDTININPKITPKVDQKQILDDARINYMAAYDGVYTLDSLWTSQERFTQLSYANNILLIQKIIKEIRSKCPKIRYAFTSGDDLKNYQKDVREVLDKHQSKFDLLTMEYYADPRYEANKIFYAGLNVKFKNFIQDELFIITALQG